MKKKGIVWFRQDLRLHDNEAIHEALCMCDEVIYVYVFDERVIQGRTTFGFPKTGRHRLGFLVESVRDLKYSLERRGAGLLVCSGRSEDVLFDLAARFKANWIFCNRERTQEEVDVQDVLERRLWTVGREMSYSRGKMLFYTQDLPFPVTHTPDQYMSFKKEVDRITPIRPPLDIPNDFKYPSDELAVVSDQFPETDHLNPRFKGGETYGLEIIQDLLNQKRFLKQDEVLNEADRHTTPSTGLAMWLSNGCISAKKIYHSLIDSEGQVMDKASASELFQDLLWRDFLRLMGKKHGNRIFQFDGYGSEPANLERSESPEVFERWANGTTGFPLVDACMLQLKECGWLSKAGRKLCAAYFVHELGMNWLMGAEWFESLLIDYDPCSNYGNWELIAGVGSNTKRDQPVNIVNYAKRLDPAGEYIKQFLPQLELLSADVIHHPQKAVEKDLPWPYMNPLVAVE